MLRRLAFRRLGDPEIIGVRSIELNVQTQVGESLRVRTQVGVDREVTEIPPTLSAGGSGILPYASGPARFMTLGNFIDGLVPQGFDGSQLREDCGNALAIEHNGDVYSCGHFVFLDHRQGNIAKQSLLPIVESDAQVAFGKNKSGNLPQQCLDCDVLFACRGECPKNRFAKTSDGEGNLNFLCPGYLAFFRHIDPVMRHMGESLRKD